MIFKRIASLIVNNLLLEVSPSKVTCSTTKNGGRRPPSLVIASSTVNLPQGRAKFMARPNLRQSVFSQRMSFASHLLNVAKKKFPRKKYLTAYKYIHLFLIFCQIIRCNIFVFFDWLAAKRLSVLLLSQGQ